MPSRAYTSSLKKDHLLSPAARSTFSVSTHLVRKPTQEKIPLEKRLYSVTRSTASAICRVMRR